MVPKSTLNLLDVIESISLQQAKLEVFYGTQIICRPVLAQGLSSSLLELSRCAPYCNSALGDGQLESEGAGARMAGAAVGRLSKSTACPNE